MCGCTANAVRTGPYEKPARPVCSIHGCDEIDPNPPSLAGRVMRCSYGGAEKPSDPEAAFFRHHPERDADEYYCGCYGWD